MIPVAGGRWNPARAGRDRRRLTAAGEPGALDREGAEPDAGGAFPAGPWHNGSVDKDGAFQVRGLFGPVLLPIGVLAGDWIAEIGGTRRLRDLADDPDRGSTWRDRPASASFNRPTYVRGGLTDEKRQRAEGTVFCIDERKSPFFPILSSSSSIASTADSGLSTLRSTQTRLRSSRAAAALPSACRSSACRSTGRRACR